MIITRIRQLAVRKPNLLLSEKTAFPPIWNVYNRLDIEGVACLPAWTDRCIHQHALVFGPWCIQMLDSQAFGQTQVVDASKRAGHLSSAGHALDCVLK